MSSTSLAPRSVSNLSRGSSPPKARFGVRSHSTAFPPLPIISTAVAYTRARCTVRSDSAAVSRECWLKRRVKVRCGMPSLSEIYSVPMRITFALPTIMQESPYQHGGTLVGNRGHSDILRSKMDTKMS